jgi:hypothetical protein
MFDTFRGLPVHALVVHAVVVLVPLAAVGTIAIAFRPVWRRIYGPLVVAVATIGLVCVPVATRSGSKLINHLHATGVVAKQILHHESMGKRVIWPTLAMWVLVLALVLLDRRRGKGRGVTVVAVLAAVAAVAALAQVAITGELGSTAVWSCTIGSSACK